MAMLMPIIVALLALAWVPAFQAAGRRLGMLPPIRNAAAAAVAAPPQEGSLRPSASTRMAIQMAVALAVSFLVGYLFFPERWAWIVLTAFIVNSGNRGRLDVAYKSVLRVVGAGAGTIVALTLSIHVGNHDATTAALILSAVFLGLWLRPLNYAWWALFITIALALLQGFSGATPQAILWPRLEEIIIGAVIGVASAWAVYPVRSTAVLRRRIADALAALSEAFDPATEERISDAFVAALDQVEQVAPAFRASRLLTYRRKRVHPADWIDALFACRYHAIVLINEGATPGEVRKNVGAARRAMREPETLLPALQALRDAMSRRD
jgi:uncharacterized membrane protein YccC